MLTPVAGRGAAMTPEREQELRSLDFVAGTSLRALFASIDELAARAVRAEAALDEIARISAKSGNQITDGSDGCTSVSKPNHSEERVAADQATVKAENLLIDVAVESLDRQFAAAQAGEETAAI